MSKRDIHQHVLSKLRALPSADEEVPAVETRRPSTYMGQVGVELKTGLKSRIEELEAQLASGEVVLQLDPKRIRATAFRNRDDRSLSTDDESFGKLKDDIRTVGNRAPIEVRSLAGVADFEYEIVSGHRRHAACLQLDEEIAGGFRVRALIIDDARDPVELVKGMHRENFLRENPSPYEYGMLYAAAMKAGVFPDAGRPRTGCRQQPDERLTPHPARGIAGRGTGRVRRPAVDLGTLDQGPDACAQGASGACDRHGEGYCRPRGPAAVRSGEGRAACAPPRRPAPARRSATTSRPSAWPTRRPLAPRSNGTVAIFASASARRFRVPHSCGK